MFSILVFAALNAQSQGITIQLPTNISQCVPATIKWSGGVAPYALIASPNPVTVVDIVRVYINITGNFFDWTPSFDTQTYVFLSLSDSTGAVARSGGFIPSASNDTSCLRSQPAPTSSSPEATSTAEEGESANSPSTDTGSRGLNGGAIAGIVVGSLVAAVVLAFLALWISRMRALAARKRARASPSHWQALSDISSRRGGYAFDGGAAQLEKHADKSASPIFALNQSSSLVEDVSPHRAVAEPLPQYPPTSPV
ncbi:uncharacterized protein TRAVEDRAFT_54010 [Trametes versicolor FP-101664 SS1]|uniref:Mid2 domain-containing protein n=1 Tax=Trametes versicolor (strain FP-101664) TaxID=717944 RepID=R7S8L6_TRAVS|nr:uncharacterized protein TRAVEDRAFT_54010 [Trametes versicolor FP-101664 SS1]EIW52030.1 hypothetical protein TRAVEDRAFT_54010 [Trametes versicolor FP-101664 SS1]